MKNGKGIFDYIGRLPILDNITDQIISGSLLKKRKTSHTAKTQEFIIVINLIYLVFLVLLVMKSIHPSRSIYATTAFHAHQLMIMYLMVEGI